VALIVRQSTAITVVLGPFVDSADGVTAETGLTISQADVRLSKNAGAFAQANDANAAAHMENGYYSKALSTTDTNTVGSLVIAVSESGALPVWCEYQVIEEAVYDIMFAGSATGAVPVASIATGAITAAAIANGAIDAATFAADVDAEILSYLVDDATRIDASALNTLSSHDPGETIMGATDLGTGAGLTTLATQASVNTIDDILDTEFPALVTAVADLPTNAELATALGTADDAVLAAIAALNNLSAAQVNTEVDTAISDAALATAANLATVDTVVDAIKVQTDKLTFTVAGTVDSNITHVIADPVQVNGADDTNWGGAP
jgi:hypothetical protein